MNALVDTSIIIDYLRLNEKSIFFNVFNQKGDLLISFITIVELYAGRGLAKKIEKQRVDSVIGAASIIDGNIEIYKKSGEILRETPNLFFQDAVIAATAIYHKIPLLTLNIKDFKKIKGLSLYPHSRS